MFHCYGCVTFCVLFVGILNGMLISERIGNLCVLYLGDIRAVNDFKNPCSNKKARRLSSNVNLDAY